MNIYIKSPVKIDYSKKTLMHYIDSKHDIPIKVLGVNFDELKNNKSFGYIYRRLVNIISTLLLQNVDIVDFIFEFNN